MEKFTVSSIKRAQQRPDEDLRRRPDVDEEWRLRRALRKSRRPLRLTAEAFGVTYWS